MSDSRRGQDADDPSQPDRQSHRQSIGRDVIDRVVIIGVGAMACLFGAKLCRHVPVTLVGRWPEQLAALEERGLTVVELDGGRTVLPLQRNREQALAGLHVQTPDEPLPRAALVLVLVKSRGTPEAVEIAARAVAPGGVALTLQNGLGNLELLTRAVGPKRAALGVTTQGAHILEPGVVRHAGEGATQLAGSAASEHRLSAVVDLFEVAALPATAVPSVEPLLWGKLAVNAAINPLAALLEVPNGVLLEWPATVRLLERSAREVEKVARLKGITLPFDAATRALEVCRATAANRGSMAQDLAHGRETEIEVISGAVARQARRVGTRAPLNELLTQLVRAAASNGQVGSADWRMALWRGPKLEEDREWRQDLRWLRRQIEGRSR